MRKFFSTQKIFLNFDFYKICKNEIEDTNDIYLIDSAMHFTTKSIFRSKNFKEIIRERWS